MDQHHQQPGRQAASVNVCCGSGTAYSNSNHVKYPKRQTLKESLSHSLHGRCLCLTLLIYLCLAVVFWCQIDNMKQTLITLKLIDDSHHHHHHHPHHRHSKSDVVNVKSSVSWASSSSSTTSSTANCKQGAGFLTFPLVCLVVLYIAYAIECWHSSTRFLLLNGKTTEHVYKYIDQMRQAKPIIWWKAASYHYVRYYTSSMSHNHHQLLNATSASSACHQMDASTATSNTTIPPPFAALSSTNNNNNTSVTSASSIPSSSFFSSSTSSTSSAAVPRYYKKRIDTRYSSACFLYNRHYHLKDISEHLVGLELFPITRIHFYKGFVFSDEQSAREFDRQRSNFFRSNFKLDQYLEIREGIDLNGIDYQECMIALGDRQRYRYWYCSTLAFWLFSLILLSWPLRILLEYNTAYVNYRTVKLLGLVDTQQQQQHQTSNIRCQNFPRPFTMDSISNYTIAPSYSEAVLIDTILSNNNNNNNNEQDNQDNLNQEEAGTRATAADDENALSMASSMDDDDDEILDKHPICQMDENNNGKTLTAASTNNHYLPSYNEVMVFRTQSNHSQLSRFSDGLRQCLANLFGTLHGTLEHYAKQNLRRSFTNNDDSFFNQILKNNVDDHNDYFKPWGSLQNVTML